MKTNQMTLILLLSSCFCYACECNQVLSVSEEYNKIEFVFIGKVIETKEIKYEGQSPKSLDYGRITKFKLIKKYKGKLDSIITIQSGYGGPDCGRSFDKNKTYLVYSYTLFGNLWTDGCNRTDLIEKVEEEIKILDEIIKSK